MKNRLQILILLFLHCATVSAQPAFLPLDEVKKEFQQIMEEFRSQPTSEKASELSFKLGTLNDRTPFVSSQPQNPFSQEYKKFHLQMAEFRDASSRLASCAGEDRLLKRRAVEISNAMIQGALLSTNEPKVIEYTSALNFIDHTCSRCKTAEQGASAMERLMTDELLEKTHVADQVKGMNPYAREKLAMEQPQLQREQEEKEKLEKLANDQLLNTVSFSPEIASYVNHQYGFQGLGWNDSEVLHDELMRGNRESTFRNYLYLTRHFSFSGEPVLTLEETAKTLFGNVKELDGATTLPDGEAVRLAREIGEPLLDQFKKNFPVYPSLSENAVIAQLGSVIAACGEMQGVLDEDTRINQLTEWADAATPRYINHRDLKKTYKKILQSMEEATRASEIGFLVGTRTFQNNLRLMCSSNDSVSLPFKQAVIQGALHEVLVNTKRFAQWIDENQGHYSSANPSSDFRKGASVYTESAEVLLYSSPMVIQKVILKHPFLAGNLCRPMSRIVKAGATRIPSWAIWTAGSLTLMGPEGIVVGLTILGMSELDHLEKIDALNRKIAVLGHGDPIQERNQTVEADRKDLRRDVNQQEIAMLKDAAIVAGSYLGGRVIGDATSYFLGVLNQKLIEIAALKLATNNGVTQAAMEQEIIELTVEAEKLLGRSLNQTEMKALYVARQSGIAMVDFLSQAGFKNTEAKLMTDFLASFTPGTPVWDQAVYAKAKASFIERITFHLPVKRAELQMAEQKLALFDAYSSKLVTNPLDASGYINTLGKEEQGKLVLEINRFFDLNQRWFTSNQGVTAANAKNMINALLDRTIDEVPEPWLKRYVQGWVPAIRSEAKKLARERYTNAMLKKNFVDGLKTSGIIKNPTWLEKFASWLEGNPNLGRGINAKIVNGTMLYMQKYTHAIIPVFPHIRLFGTSSKLVDHMIMKGFPALEEAIWNQCKNRAMAEATLLYARTLYSKSVSLLLAGYVVMNAKKIGGMSQQVRSMYGMSKLTNAEKSEFQEKTFDLNKARLQELENTMEAIIEAPEKLTSHRLWEEARMLLMMDADDFKVDYSEPKKLEKRPLNDDYDEIKVEVEDTSPKVEPPKKEKIPPQEPSPDEIKDLAIRAIREMIRNKQPGLSQADIDQFEEFMKNPPKP